MAVWWRVSEGEKSSGRENSELNSSPPSFLESESGSVTLEGMVSERQQCMTT